MSLALRDQRARIYAYTDQGDSGVAAHLYAVVPSPDPDQAWWCRVEEPGGHELTVGQGAEHQSGAVIAFSAEVPVPLNGVVVLLRPDGSTGPLYRVASVSPRRQVGEIAVTGVFADHAVYTLVD